MRRQDLFKFSAVGSVILLVTMFSYFWYSAGVIGFGYPLRYVLWGIVILFVYALSAVSASRSMYIERKHSVTFSIVTLVPIVLYLVVFLLEGEIIDFAIGFAYTMFIVLILSSISYIVSIFVKE